MVFLGEVEGKIMYRNMKKTVRFVSAVFVAAVSVWTLQVSAAGGKRPGFSRRSMPLKILRYAEQVVRRYDQNGNGQLEGDELKTLKTADKLDRNNDNVVTAEEIAFYIYRYSREHRISKYIPRQGFYQLAASAAKRSGAEKASRRPSSRSSSRSRRNKRFYVDPSFLKGLPNWFFVLDRDGDGQLSLAEFAPRVTESALKKFAEYDQNGDGLLEPEEILEPRERRSRSRENRGIEEADKEAENVPVGAEEDTKSKTAEEEVNREETPKISLEKERPSSEETSNTGLKDLESSKSKHSKKKRATQKDVVPERPLRHGASKHAHSTSSRSKRKVPAWWSKLSPEERRKILWEERKKRLEELRRKQKKNKDSAQHSSKNSSKHKSPHSKK